MQVNAGVVMPPIFGGARLLPPLFRAVPPPSRLVRAGLTATQLKRLFDLSRGEGTGFSGVLGMFPLEDYALAANSRRSRRMRRARDWRP